MFDLIKKEIYKIIIAGIAALIVLNMLCLVYDFPPQVLQDWETSCPTGLSHRHNQFYSKASEGLGWGYTDDNGYVNPDVPDSYDIVLMGGSHIQALQVMQEQSVTQQLDGLFESNGNKRNVYNIGMSAWSFTDSAKYMQQVCENLNPTQYVCVELMNLNVDDWRIKEALNEGVDKETTHSRLKDVLFYLPFFRKISAIISTNLGVQKDLVTTSEGSYNNELDILIVKMQETVAAYNAKLLIFYHPSIALEKDGSVRLSDDYANIDMWKKICDENGVLFVDISPYFIEGYVKSKRLPYGFSNTGVGEGHINAYGHQMIARAIYEFINQYERN